MRPSRSPRADEWWEWYGYDSDAAPTVTVHERGTREAFWSILNASGERIPRTDLPTKQAFIGFYELKDHT